MASLPPKACISIPPTLQTEARALREQQPIVHGAWQRCEQRGRYFVLRSSSLDDLSELADWAQCSLVEPEKPLSRAEKAAFKAVLQRVGRWAHLEPLGASHCLAVAWKSDKQG